MAAVVVVVGVEKGTRACSGGRESFSSVVEATKTVTLGGEGVARDGLGSVMDVRVSDETIGAYEETEMGVSVTVWYMVMVLVALSVSP
jgi:hypothetical protein